VVAEQTLIPYLKNQGVHHIDKLIISHLDKDHSGGLQSVLNHFDVKEVIANEKIAALNNGVCQSGMKWQLDGVNFQFLTANHLTGNNGSCVLKVSVQGKSILLTGDIYKTAERYLLKTYPEILASTILLAPHHGSGSSSSREFIKTVEPEYVIFSSSTHEGFKHPHNEVVQTYLDEGAKILNTAQHGAITAVFKDNGGLSIQTNKVE
jgi:competence protein ComEC